MPEDRIPVRVNGADRERIGYWAVQHGTSPLKYLEQLIHEAARSLDPVPNTAPRVRRTLSEVRAQRRADLGGVSPYTAAIPIIRQEQR